MTSPVDASTPPPARTTTSKLVRAFLAVVIALIVVMWVYALFFASKEAVNKIGDRDWAKAAQARCEQAEEERLQLADFRTIEEVGPGALAGRAALLDQATDILESMLDDINATPPADAKGQELIPLWTADYRTYLEDRREYTARLRQGENPPFSETKVDGIPISEKLGTFAADNEMSACSPPTDVSA